ncbi:redox-sensing transcriptional repressor [Desulfohalotomaculum tongense]|uniref:redox-sensing transcriptional repressor Rex n=1 Tax=Desulforadius tongensis TaxID=1216062 RepID=UPI00195C28F6|nr:redox-sensing transcriptional repressor Rex [Desulforadius tongensis]MBM7853783.1 redox-sensing transcriptional repressor [Desulforadius tongensis]
MVSAGGIPKAIAKRLPLYHRCLAKLREQGKYTVSSKELSREVGVEATMIRKDLTYFGELGKRGVGYNVELLYRTIGRTLNLDQHWEVIIVGTGKMASALVEYNCLYGRNFRIVAAFAPGTVSENMMVEHLTVQPLSALPKFVQDRDIKMAVLATSDLDAQVAANIIVRSGIRAILNFSPVDVCVPEDIKLLNNIITTEMQILACCLEGIKK